MEFLLSDLVGKVRIAIDEVEADSVDSTFVEELNTEIKQALWVAVLQLCDELPDELLMPTTLPSPGDNLSGTALKTPDDGSGYLLLPTCFLRLVKLKLRSWEQSLRELTDPLSDEAKMQVSKWTRGTPQKPKALLGASKEDSVDGEPVVKRVLEYFTAGTTTVDGTTSYDHSIEVLSYIAAPTTDGSSISAPVGVGCEPFIIYRAAGIVMDGKGQSGLADRFYQLSQTFNHKNHQ